MNIRQPAARKPFRAIKGPLLGYLGIGIAALVAVVLLRNHPAEVDWAAWVRSIIPRCRSAELRNVVNSCCPSDRYRTQTPGHARRPAPHWSRRL